MEQLPIVKLIIKMYVQKLVLQMTIMIDGCVDLQTTILQFVGMDLTKMNLSITMGKTRQVSFGHLLWIKSI